jgi:hypothetical protein
MRSLVLASWSMGGRSSGRNGRAKRDGGGRTEGAVLSQEVYGDDDVCVVEIAMQVGAGMQAGRQAGRREAAGH